MNDTLSLARQISLGTSIGVAVTVFPKSHLGVRVALSYLNASLTDQCAPAAPFQVDSTQKNAQVCSSLSSGAGSIGLVTLSGSFVFRISPHHSMSPYARIGGGIGVEWGETLAASGTFVDNGRVIERTLVRDSSSEAVKPFLDLAVGVTSGLGVESRIRAEVSDLALPVQRLLGPADASGRAPHAGKLVHNVSFTFGIDFVIGAHHGRRY